MAEFEEAGVNLLLLQCSPQFEEMERFAETVIPSRAPARIGSEDGNKPEPSGLKRTV